MYHKTRDEFRNKLMSYVYGPFLNLISNEFQKYESEKHHFSFETIKNKWAVVTNTKIRYSALGYFQDDSKEEIEHITLGINISINEKLMGEFIIEFTPERGFYNLEDCIKTAISALDLSTIPESENSYPEFSVQNIAINKPVTKETLDNDPRIGDIIGHLTSMNFSKRRAEKYAQEIVLKFPNIHDIDTLVDEILQMQE